MLTHAPLQDASGHGYSANPVGGPLLTGSYLTLNGQQQYVQFPAALAPAIKQPSFSITMSFYVAKVGSFAGAP